MTVRTCRVKNENHMAFRYYRGKTTTVQGHGKFSLSALAQMDSCRRNNGPAHPHAY
jgi:hypothetical protein